MTQDASSSSLIRDLGAVYGDVFSPANLKASFHLLLNLVVGTVSFVVVVFLLVATIGFLIVFPLAVVTGWLLWATARGMGIFERFRIRIFLGKEIPEPVLPPATKSLGERMKGWLTDGAAWRSICYVLLLLPVGILTFTGVVVAWSVPFGSVALAILNPNLPGVAATSQVVLGVLGGLIGLGLIPFIPYPVRALSELNRAMGKVLLGPSSTAALEKQVSHLAASRSHVADAAEDERRRIERDLHDGAQQRLVSLAMNLGMAKEKIGSDIDGAKELVEEAHTETKRALTELRDLARGIHPAILSDRGLEAALTPVVALSPVPVTLNVDVAERPEPRLESIAYFLVSETLANIAKHAHATRASVSIVQQNDRLVVEVTDDGRGGADPAGGGLVGLRSRVEGVDGWFSVTSPVGGPTAIVAEMPCQDATS